MDNMNLNLLKTGLSLKTSLSLYLALTLPKKKYEWHRFLMKALLRWDNAELV